MIPVSRAVCILAFGFILGVTQDYAYAQMGSHKSGDDGARIGGQAGLPYNHMNQSRLSTSAENHSKGESDGRIGGQAGLPYNHVNHSRPSTPAESHSKSAAGVRIGGQAGEGYGALN